jgi:undecaprenyl diphosphate synthase
MHIPKEFNFEKIPNHVAIIMDGNRRWADKNKLNYLRAYSKGASNLQKILKIAASLGVKTLTVYAFSTENWQRPQSEIDALMYLFEKYLLKKTPSLIKERVKLKAIGDISKLSKNLQDILLKSIDATKNGDKINLVLALNYGGRDEITRAVKKLLIDYDEDKSIKDKISEKFFEKYLDTSEEPDFVIRTGGEFRLSNFLLWQSSYSEFYSTEALWPEFSEKQFLEAILNFQKRRRRFGKL